MVEHCRWTAGAFDLADSCSRALDRPVAIIESTQVRTHAISLMDDHDPHRRARPDGTSGCDIQVFVGPNHPTEGDFRSVKFATRMHETVSFPMTEGGMTAWYRFRRMNTKGDYGPFSPILTTRRCAAYVNFEEAGLNNTAFRKKNFRQQNQELIVPATNTETQPVPDRMPAQKTME